MDKSLAIFRLPMPRAVNSMIRRAPHSSTTSPEGLLIWICVTECQHCTETHMEQVRASESKIEQVGRRATFTKRVAHTKCSLSRYILMHIRTTLTSEGHDAVTVGAPHRERCRLRRHGEPHCVARSASAVNTTFISAMSTTLWSLIPPDPIPIFLVAPAGTPP